MKLSSLRGWFALFLMTVAFSSAPMGSLEQLVVPSGEQTLVDALNGAAPAPSLGSRGFQPVDLNVIVPPRASLSIVPLLEAVPEASTDGRRPPAASLAHFTYDALAPPLI